MGRLMKYDLRAAMKLFVPLWIGTLFLSIVNRFTLPAIDQMENGAVRLFFGLIMTAYVLAILAIVIVAIIYIVLRFYQGLLKDEGYLTFTLPVSIDAILWSKALTGVVLLTISGAVAILSMFMQMMEQGDLKILGGVLMELLEAAGTGNTVMIFICAILAAVSTCLSSIFQAYCAMGFGQLAQKRKLAASILAYVIISFVISMVTGVGVMPLAVHVLEMLGKPNVLQIFNGPHGVWVLLLGFALYNLLYVVVFYFPARYIFKNKLNLE